jgi:hypothetical protein
MHATLYEAYERMLSELRNELLTGEVVSDRATVERLIRSVGALLRLHDRHRIDWHGRCTVCLADTPRMVATLAETVRLHDTRGADILFFQQQPIQAPVR